MKTESKAVEQMTRKELIEEGKRLHDKWMTGPNVFTVAEERRLSAICTAYTDMGHTTARWRGFGFLGK